MTATYMTRLLILALVLTHATAALPQPKPPQVPPGDDVIVPLRLGEPAPFTGQLYGTATALRWANWLEWYRRQREIEFTLHRSLLQAETTLRLELVQAERAHGERQSQDLRLRLTESRTKLQDLQNEHDSPPWYRQSWFWFGSGAFLATAAFVVGLLATR